jgi:hypothetical protein
MSSNTAKRNESVLRSFLFRDFRLLVHKAARSERGVQGLLGESIAEKE